MANGSFLRSNSAWQCTGQGSVTDLGGHILLCRSVTFFFFILLFLLFLFFPACSQPMVEAW